MTPRPRVLLTRDEAGCSLWSEKLVKLGAEPVSWPCLRHEYVHDEVVERSFVENLLGARWLAFGSGRGAHAVQGILARRNQPLPPLVRLAAVGARSAEAAREELGRVDLIAQPATAAGLVRCLLALGNPTDLSPVVIATSNLGRPQLENELAGVGVAVSRHEVYRTCPTQPPAEVISMPTVDAVFLASPSALRGLLNQAVPPSNLPLITIGPTTSAAVREAGLSVAAEAATPSLEGLLTAFLDLGSGNDRGRRIAS